MVDAVDSKSSGRSPCRFESDHRQIIFSLENLAIYVIMTIHSWGRFGLDRAFDVSKRRVGVLFSVNNKQKKINGNVIDLRSRFAPAQAVAA